MVGGRYHGFDAPLRVRTHTLSSRLAIDEVGLVPAIGDPAFDDVQDPASAGLTDGVPCR